MRDWAVDLIVVDVPTGYNVVGFPSGCPSWNVEREDYWQIPLMLGKALLQNDGCIVFFSSSLLHDKKPVLLSSDSPKELSSTIKSSNGCALTPCHSSQIQGRYVSQSKNQFYGLLYMHSMYIRDFVSVNVAILHFVSFNF